VVLLTSDERLCKKTILLTGGTGFFGRALLDYFKKLCENRAFDFKLIILSRNPEKFKKKYPVYADLDWLTFEVGDVTDLQSMQSNVSVDYVIHAAGESTLGPTLEPFDRFYKIFNGTRNILDVSVKRGASRFLYVSSGAVYGSSGKLDISLTENSPLCLDASNDESAYGLAKLASEHQSILFSKKYNLEVIIARCFSFSGVGLPLNAHFALGNFIRDIKTKGVIVVNGLGLEVRSYMDQRDLAVWLLTLLICGKNGGIYNVGSNEKISIKELAFKIKSLVSMGAVVDIKGLTPPRQGRISYVPDISKALAMGLTLNFSLNDSILEMAKKFDNSGDIFM
jgi:UDP-glucuronate decarboxylase